MRDSFMIRIVQPETYSAAKIDVSQTEVKCGSVMGDTLRLPDVFMVANDISRVDVLKDINVSETAAKFS